MKHFLRIDELLDLYIKGQLEGDELNHLFESINHDKDPEHVTAWFYRIWDESHADHPERKSEESFNLLREKLNLKAHDVDFANLSQNKKKIHTIIKPLLKYAAVFLFALGAAWYFFGYNRSYIQTVKVSANEIYVPLGSKSHLILTDGTNIWLNSGSRMKYTEFTNTPAREVFLEGEAFFDVVKNARKPFIVNTSSVRVKVLGTKFNVKSYPTEKTIETTLVTGKVEIEELNPFHGHNKIIELHPNQKATYIKSSSEINVEKNLKKQQIQPKQPQSGELIEKVNPVLYTSWKDQKLIFKNERLESLAVKLERWYNVKIVIKDQAINNYRYTGIFEKENIEQVMKALKLATPLNYTIDKNNISIYKGN